MAVTFFVAGLVAVADLGGAAFAWFGVTTPLGLDTLPWTLAAFVIALFALLYGVYLLVRLHPAPQWLMAVMTLYFTLRFFITPADGSVLYSPARVFVNRLVLLLPLIVSCGYLYAVRRRARS